MMSPHVFCFSNPHLNFLLQTKINTCPSFCSSSKPPVTCSRCLSLYKRTRQLAAAVMSRLATAAPQTIRALHATWSNNDCVAVTLIPTSHMCFIQSIIHVFRPPTTTTINTARFIIRHHRHTNFILHRFFFSHTYGIY